MNESNIVESTLIGTGGGYGESVVLHLGNNDWMVVDSCINPITNDSLPLEYLVSRGVNIERDVKLIVCTHWHDDHIRGISQLLDHCKNSIFSCSIASDRVKFLQFVGLDYMKIKDEETTCSTIEINNCLKILSSRKSIFNIAVNDKVLLSSSDKDISYEVISLSPSEYVVNEYSNEISTLITDYGKSNKKIICQSPNEKSVVILIKINDQRILLGSDLEVCDDERKGWRCIINHSQTLNHNKSQVFKIPHHGSHTGYDKAIWDVITDEKTIAKLSPWNRGDRLPKKEVLEKIIGHTDNLFSTSIPNGSKLKPKKREKRIAKAIDRFNHSLQEVKYIKGIVRCEFNIEERVWRVETIDAGKKITQDLMQYFN